MPVPKDLRYQVHLDRTSGTSSSSSLDASTQAARNLAGMSDVVWFVTPSDREFERLSAVVQKITAREPDHRISVSRMELARHLAGLRFTTYHGYRKSYSCLDLTLLRRFLQQAEKGPSVETLDRLLRVATRVIARQRPEAAGRDSDGPTQPLERKALYSDLPPPNLPRSQVKSYMYWRNLIIPTPLQYAGVARSHGSESVPWDGKNVTRVPVDAPPPYSLAPEEDARVRTMVPKPGRTAKIASGAVGHLEGEQARLKELQEASLCNYCRRIGESFPRYGKPEEKPGWFSWHFMHCSGCGVDHPLRLFSQEQQRTDRWNRKCIGHSGKVKLCDHVSLSWDSVQAMMGLLDQSLEGGSDGPGPVVCHHPSHVPTHHEEDESMHPTFEVRYGDRNAFDGTVAVLSYTAHMCLDEEHDGPLSAKAFRCHVDKIRQGCGQFLAPETYPDILQEMRCVDLNTCACLQWEENETPREWPPAMESTCRHSQGTAGLDALRAGPGHQRTVQGGTSHTATHILYSPFSDSNIIDVNLSPCAHQSGENRTRCVTVRYERQIQLREGSRRQRQPVAEMSKFKIDRLATLRASCLGYIPWGWYQAVEEFQLPTNDFGLGWCRTRGCKNFHGYAREHPLHHQRLNLACKDGCSRPIPRWLFRDIQIARPGAWLSYASNSDYLSHGSFPWYYSRVGASWDETSVIPWRPELKWPTYLEHTKAVETPKSFQVGMDGIIRESSSDGRRPFDRWSSANLVSIPVTLFEVQFVLQVGIRSHEDPTRILEFYEASTLDNIMSW